MWGKKEAQRGKEEEKGNFPLIVEVCAGVVNAFPFLLTPVCANSAEFDSQPASAETRPINFYRFAWPITANIFTGVPVQFSAGEHTRDIHDKEDQKQKQQEIPTKQTTKKERSTMVMAAMIISDGIYVGVLVCFFLLCTVKFP